MSKKEPRLTDAEWTVMQAVWTAAPATARDVLDAVGEDTEWAYTTVKTLLARLVEKGILNERRRGNASVYEPRFTQGEARGTALRSLLERAFGGSLGALVQHMASEEKLTRKEREKLARLLAEDES
jgi:BlaI family penicillinase repressor